MATIITDVRDLPEATADIAGRKPPVTAFPWQDPDNPEEVDEFLAFIHTLRQSSPVAVLPVDR